jgi:pimeloyl-[acyl-carrier protein] methyl ester esterase
MKIIFVHGWGADAHYWDGLAALVHGGEDAQRVDLGYTNKHSHYPDDDALYITHSLGTLWALKNRAHNMHGLIAINGFACFKSFTDPNVLRVMKNGLTANLASQMHAFYCAASMPQQDELNPEHLTQGLELLAKENARSALDALERPVMALLSGKDKIVPLEAVREQWSPYDVKICEEGGHNIPQSHAQWCADHINAYVKEHRT